MHLVYSNTIFVSGWNACSLQKNVAFLRQYITSKPAKYGIKNACTARTFYAYNMEINAGTQPDRPYKADKEYNLSMAVAIRLICDMSGSARNITFDNWYTSYSQVESLLCDHKLTAVETLRTNKREISPELFVTKERHYVKSMFGFQDNLTLFFYILKSDNKKKNMVLLSSMHHENKIDHTSGGDKKLNTLTFYNSTKVGIDGADMMDEYNVSKNSRRWPLTVFLLS